MTDTAPTDPNQEKEPPIVRIRDLTKRYLTGARTVSVFDGLSFAAQAGEYVSIIGPSGSGKTTLFNLIGGLDAPDSGEIRVGGRDIARLTPSEAADFRCRKIGFIFQTFNLLHHLTALENAMLPLVLANRSPRQAEERARDLLERVGLADRLRHLARELSGGQQQRVAIARAFANEPAIILADEPTGNLDPRSGREIIGLLREMNRERGITILTGTHDAEMLEASDRVLRLNDGRLDPVGGDRAREFLSGRADPR